MNQLKEYENQVFEKLQFSDEDNASNSGRRVILSQEGKSAAVFLFSKYNWTRKLEQTNVESKSNNIISLGDTSLVI